MHYADLAEALEAWNGVVLSCTLYASLTSRAQQSAQPVTFLLGRVQESGIRQPKTKTSDGFSFEFPSDGSNQMAGRVQVWTGSKMAPVRECAAWIPLGSSQLKVRQPHCHVFGRIERSCSTVGARNSWRHEGQKCKIIGCHQGHLQDDTKTFVSSIQSEVQKIFQVSKAKI